MKQRILFGSFLFFMVGMSACSVAAESNKGASPKNEEFIVGTWRLDGELPPEKSGHSFHWFLEYTFNADGTFLQTGYPPLMQKGKYKVVKSEDDKLTVTLYEQSGNFGDKDKQIEIVIDKDKETLKIDGKEGFRKNKK